MAWPTAINDQITDAVTQSNLSVLGQASATAIGASSQSLAQAFGMQLQAQQASSARMSVLRGAITTSAAAALNKT
ncbi:RebB family R body protein [uncultured Pelagimonas sp.]|uniref:RebB family R body protein n=1 Tax=uncultured Pelagimonas sp. TaxID=1618102 RepID=UPI00261938E9|nr:RebB family R body protein [uncultured Pelagimonas sp.]